MNERHAVRAGAVAVTAAALVLPVFMAVPPKLPATAMGSGLLLYLERGLVVFAVLLLLLVFLYRSLVQGELPKAISGRGAEWTDLGAASRATFRELEMEVDDLRSAIQELREALAMEG